MITADSSMIDTSGQLVVVEKVETNLQTLTPSIPTLAPNPKHGPREQTNLEYPNLDSDAEKWMMQFCHTIKQQTQLMV